MHLFESSPAMRRFAIIGITVVFLSVFVVSGASYAATSSTTSNSAAACPSSKNGSFKVYLDDDGEGESRIHYTVTYKKLEDNKVKICNVLMTDPYALEYHMWAWTCWNDCEKRDWVCDRIPDETWDSETLNWTVKRGKVLKVAVTNEVDCTGRAGETWHGTMTIP